MMKHKEKVISIILIISIIFVSLILVVAIKTSVNLLNQNEAPQQGKESDRTYSEGLAQDDEEFNLDGQDEFAHSDDIEFDDEAYDDEGEVDYEEEGIDEDEYVEYDSIDDTWADLAGIKEDAVADVLRLKMKGEYTANDIEFVYNYFMSEIYWGNYYLYKDFDVIAEKFRQTERLNIEMIDLLEDYYALLGRVAGSKGRNGLPVFEELRRQYTEIVEELAEMDLPYYDGIAGIEVVFSDEWEALKEKTAEAYAIKEQLQASLYFFLKEVAPSQAYLLEGRIERMESENDTRDRMGSYY